MDCFPDDVAEKLGWYVYRLIDPRNVETFYVGKGKANRIFEHIKAAVVPTEDEDAVDLKLQRIKDIKDAGMDVLHVIHRHRIVSYEVASQIEAALIEAYSGNANRVGGNRSGDFGCRFSPQIVAEYSAVPFVPLEPLMLISIGRSLEHDSKDIYDFARGVWRINPARVARYNLALAHRRGIVLGAYRPSRWVAATKVNFPWLDADIEGRIGFEGERAETEVWEAYVGKRIPDAYRERGATNPVRFIW